MKATIALLLLFICVAFPAGASAESARSLTALGNELYAKGEYDKALEAYEQAGAEQPDSAEIWFNKGSVFVQKGDYDKAREAYETAAVRARDLSLEARSHFNLGNTAFLEGQKQLSQDAKKALSQLGSSVRHYQEALRVDPELRDAARNIEVARVKMKDVLDLIRKQEEQSKEQKARQEEMLKQLKEAVGEQESEVGASRELKKKMDEKPGKDFREETEKLAEDQNRTKEKTGEVSDKVKAFQSQSQPQGQGAQGPASQQPQGEQAQGDPTQSAAEHLEKAIEAQKSAVEKLENSRPDAATDHQQEALDSLKEALAKLSGSQEDKQAGGDQKNKDGEEQGKEKSAEQKSGEDQKSEEGQKDGQSSQKQSDEQKKQQQQQEEQKRQSAEQQQKMQQGEKGQGGKDDEPKARAALRELPNDILREEKENRLQFERSRSGAYQPVDRDW